MAEVIWTDNAIADLDDIGEYIAKESVRYAELTISKLFSAPDILEKYPRRGHIVPEFMDESIRQLMVGNYRIVYQLAGDQVNILTVHHGKRLISNTRHFKKKK
ncbi:type II toxin-antitoxin system RelE/ParE family toxin [Parapedobacter tibetensis]|uniref:type II toxin-antitoxin system RelE/ParE family toxin n=1 Tax=Parapedobacter tibetensis TaxID=2972951 RepID=UPI00214D3036|nr:type II toxin-antitoxin system RelE/ParE family toxin [Parapedobacter tibetensis]